MDPRQVAAQFAAYTWFVNSQGGQEGPREATRFAHRSWRAFRGCAPEGLGRLLLRLRRARRKAARPRPVPAVAGRSG